MSKHKTMQDFEAEGDAHTLAEADVIKQTPARKKAAARAAKSLATEQSKKAAGMKKVARLDKSTKARGRSNRKR